MNRLRDLHIYLGLDSYLGGSWQYYKPILAHPLPTLHQLTVRPVWKVRAEANQKPLGTHCSRPGGGGEDLGAREWRFGAGKLGAISVVWCWRPVNWGLTPGEAGKRSVCGGSWQGGKNSWFFEGERGDRSEGPGRRWMLRILLSWLLL